MFGWLDGKKTNIVGFGMLLYNAGGLLLHYMGSGGLDPKEAADGVMVALGLLGLRSAVKKAETPQA